MKGPKLIKISKLARATTKILLEYL